MLHEVRCLLIDTIVMCEDVREICVRFYIVECDMAMLKCCCCVLVKHPPNNVE